MTVVMHLIFSVLAVSVGQELQDVGVVDHDKVDASSVVADDLVVDHDKVDASSVVADLVADHDKNSIHPVLWPTIWWLIMTKSALPSALLKKVCLPVPSLSFSLLRSLFSLLSFLFLCGH